ncbi:MAG: hypothetical protein NTZ69_17280 [Bacteroidia bacterium]|nr:hypothetical protein [Bacteroidia bacterium]
MKRFSKRQGHTISDIEITVREDAPVELRHFIVQCVYDLHKQPSFLRTVICKVLRKFPDRNNWGEYPNIALEVEDLILGCEWFNVYDIIEAIWDALDLPEREEFTNELNDYFKETGIGWKIEFGLIETRGDENFEKVISKVSIVLNSASLLTANTEIKEAIADLSRRPAPDITGAIQHSLACLECVCREAIGDQKATLGDLMKKADGVIPKPLDIAIDKIWGYTSEQGRHLREGRTPDYLEAELVVELSAAISTYLGKKLGGIDYIENHEADLPF